MSRGGRRRFTVESKAYDLVIDEVGGKLRGCIWERCKGLSSWIRFGDASLSSLLVGVESCCRDRDDSNWSLAWEEEGRKYRLERRTNEAGRFILCSVRDLEAKRFCLIFPEGKRLSGGWNTLAEKLREVGVAPFSGVKDPLSLEVLKKEKEPDQRTYADVVNLSLGRLGDKVWLEAGGRVKPGRLEQLGRCLVGRWDKVENHPPALDYLKNWAVHAWLLKGKLDIAVMGDGTRRWGVSAMVLLLERWGASPWWESHLGSLGGAGGKCSRERGWVRSCRSGSREECRGGVIVKVGQPMEQRGVVEPPGSSSKGFQAVHMSWLVGAERRCDGEDSAGSAIEVEEASKHGRF
ncbi:hypothetical protein AAG906_011548 [Vitis piasezkii]